MIRDQDHAAGTAVVYVVDRLSDGTLVKPWRITADESVMANPNPTQREFTVARDKVGTVRIVNDATQRTIAALTRREAKQLSRELRRVVKAAKK